MDPWLQLRHQAEERRRLLQRRSRQRDPRVTVRQRGTHREL
jgi:hypothetical protein